MQKFTVNDCPLKRAEKQEIEANKFGFSWENINQIIEQIQSECLEVQKDWESGDQIHLQEELGDLLQAVISLIVFCKLDPHEILLKASDKFQKRYDTVVKLAKQDGFETLHKQPFEVLMKYWNLAKN